MMISMGGGRIDMKKVIMEKEYIHEESDEFSSLAEFRSFVDRLIEKYGENSSISNDSYENISWVVEWEREETDLEYAKRTEKEREDREKKLKKKREQFEKLKKELESLGE